MKLAISYLSWTWIILLEANFDAVDVVSTGVSCGTGNKVSSQSIVFSEEVEAAHCEVDTAFSIILGILGRKKFHSIFGLPLFFEGL